MCPTITKQNEIYKNNHVDISKIKVASEIESVKETWTKDYAAVSTDSAVNVETWRNETEKNDDEQESRASQFVYFGAGCDRRKHPKKASALLYNASDHGATPRKVENAMKVRNLINPQYLMMDSYGFGILQAELKGKIITFDQNQPIKNNKKSLNITPRHVMQAALLHDADIVVGLDWPILKLFSEEEREIEFKKKKPYNVQWAFESYEWKTKLIPHAQYFQPLQGYTTDHHNYFLDEIQSVPFDGISMPIRNISISDLAEFLVILRQRGIKKVHLLGTSSFPVIALCAYVARNMFDWVSVDSTSWRFAAQFREFYHSSDLTIQALGRGVNVPIVAKNSCTCQFCNGKNFQSIQNIKSEDDKLQLILQHNYKAIENLIDDLSLKSNNLEVFGQELINRCRTDLRLRQVKKLIKVLSILDQFKNDDTNEQHLLTK